MYRDIDVDSLWVKSWPTAVTPMAKLLWTQWVQDFMLRLLLDSVRIQAKFIAVPCHELGIACAWLLCVTATMA